MANVQLSSSFRITTHQFPGQHIREYAHATSSSGVDDLMVVAKQYQPLNNLQPTVGDATIICAGGIGYIKELYEPLFESIVAAASKSGTRIRAFWIADAAGIGESALVNTERLGNDPHWFDHSRDLLNMTNHFRHEMPRPLIGMGHSYGGAQILVLIEPAVHMGSDSGVQQAKRMTKRREQWKSRAEAEAWVRNNPHYKLWDPRTVSMLLQHNFVDESGETSGGTGRVFSKTTKHQELSNMFRPNLSAVGSSGLENVDPEARLEVPDVNPSARWVAPFYRNEALIAFEALEHLRPSVQYILGEQSGHSKPHMQEARMQRTGTGVGGSGGTKWDRVRQHYIKDGQHTIPFDAHLPETAAVAANWISAEVRNWKSAEERLMQQWETRPTAAKKQVDDAFFTVIKTWDGGPRNDSAPQQNVTAKL